MTTKEEFQAPDFYKTASPDRYELLKTFAQENRRNQTVAESFLWKHIKGNQLGVKFLRQHVIYDYITDFAALEQKLIVEVDGGYHYLPEQMEWDAYRTDDLMKFGFKVIRFTNEEVLNNINRVMDSIIYELNHIERKRIIQSSHW